ncbi:MAG: GNAT family N-acetyltransferase [Anaerolineae bacterium]
MTDIRNIQRRDLIALSEQFPEPVPDYFETMYIDHLQQLCQVWVALDTTSEDAPHYLGYVRVVWESGYTQFWRRNIPEITDLYVLEAMRGQGIGRSLIASCEHVVRANGQAHIGISIEQISGHERLQAF